MPRRAQAIWEMVGGTGAVADRGWPAFPIPGEWRALAARTPLGAIAAPFEKLSDEGIAAEIDALERRKRS
jgi:hypothetical protein